jgi:adenylate cyclase
LWYILIISQIIYIFYFIISATRQGLKDAIPMASSILIILLVVIWEILDTIIFQTGIKLLQFAYFAFIISMVIILANRFIEINWETRRLNIELTHQRDSFSKFVPTQFLDLLGKKSAKDISLGECKLQEMTILFADIRDFTSLSESMSPEENFKFINSYLKRMSPVIEKNNHGNFSFARGRLASCY